MIRRMLMGLTAVAFAVMTTGCLVVTGSSYHESGVKVTRTTLDRLELGTTTEAWVIATLGEPTERTEVEGQPNVGQPSTPAALCCSSSPAARTNHVPQPPTSK